MAKLTTRLIRSIRGRINTKTLTEKSKNNQGRSHERSIKRKQTDFRCSLNPFLRMTRLTFINVLGTFLSAHYTQFDENTCKMIETLISFHETQQQANC